MRAAWSPDGQVVATGEPPSLSCPRLARRACAVAWGAPWVACPPSLWAAHPRVAIYTLLQGRLMVWCACGSRWRLHSARGTTWATPARGSWRGSRWVKGCRAVHVQGPAGALPHPWPCGLCSSPLRLCRCCAVCMQGHPEEVYACVFLQQGSSNGSSSSSDPGGSGSGGGSQGDCAAGQRLVTASGESLFLWDVHMQKLLHTAAPAPAPEVAGGGEHDGEALHPETWRERMPLARGVHCPEPSAALAPALQCRSGGGQATYLAWPPSRMARCWARPAATAACGCGHARAATPRLRRCARCRGTKPWGQTARLAPMACSALSPKTAP